MNKKAPPEPLFVLRGSTAEVYAVAFSGDGALLASGSGDGSIMLWDYATKRCTVRVEQAHTKAVAAVVFDPTQRSWLWTQGRDGLLKRWDIDKAVCVSAHDVGCEGFVPMCVGVNAAGQTVAAMPDPNDLRGVLLFRLAEEVSVVHQWALPEEFGMCMRVTMSAPLLFAAFEGAKMAVFDVDSGARLWAGDVPHSDTTEGARAPATAVCYRHGVGALASSASHVMPFAVTRTDAGGAIVTWADAPIALPRGGVSDLVLRPSDGRVLVSAGWDGRVRLFSGKPGHHKALCVCSFHTGNVHCVAYAPAGCAHANVFAAASSDRRISLWQVY